MKPNWWVKLYLPEIFNGMYRTIKHFFEKKFTIKYPEEKYISPKGYRGEHRLKKDDKGRPKCNACFLCATACPSQCISIVAGESPWHDRDKVPVKYEVNLLRCIYCGMCEEACPCDAIELTSKYTVVATSREEKIYNLEKLLNN